MISLTINYRGSNNPSKKLALKRLVNVHKPDVILLQETMTVGGQIVSDIERLLGE